MTTRGWWPGFRALVRKEFRRQAGVAAGVSAVPMLVLLGGMGRSSQFAEVACMGAAVLWLFLPVVLAANAFAGEAEEGTGQFLRQLPVSAPLVLLGKQVVVCLLTLAGAIPLLSGTLVLVGVPSAGVFEPDAGALQALSLACCVLCCACAFPAWLAACGVGVVGSILAGAAATALSACCLLLILLLNTGFGLPRAFAGLVLLGATGMWLVASWWAWAASYRSRVRRLWFVGLAILAGLATASLLPAAALYLEVLFEPPEKVFAGDVPRGSAWLAEAAISPSPDGNHLLLQQSHRWKMPRIALLDSQGHAEWISRAWPTCLAWDGLGYPVAANGASSGWSRNGQRFVYCHGTALFAPGRLGLATWWRYRRAAMVLRDTSTGSANRLLEPGSRRMGQQPVWVGDRWLFLHGSGYLHVPSSAWHPLPPSPDPVPWANNGWSYLLTSDQAAHRIFVGSARRPTDTSRKWWLRVETYNPPDLANTGSCTCASRLFELDGRCTRTDVSPDGRRLAASVYPDTGGAHAILCDLQAATGVQKSLLPPASGILDGPVFLQNGSQLLLAETATAQKNGASAGTTLVLVDLTQDRIERIPYERCALARPSPERRRVLLQMVPPGAGKTRPFRLDVYDPENRSGSTVWEGPCHAAEWWGTDHLAVLADDGLWRVRVSDGRRTRLLP
ncbi:MAG: hypothetical protein JXR77_12100 [Lentisphaeria bacterium]|nr:hypothetical protein [Lentisphaeria bacterium]